MRPGPSSCGSEGYETGACTAQRSRPFAAMSSTHEPLISLTSVPPSGSGVAPLTEPNSDGGLCLHTPVVPYWRTILCAWLMKRTRQLYASATVTRPFGNRYASSGVRK